MKKVLFFIGLLFVFGMSMVKSYVYVAPVSTMNLRNNKEILYVIDDLPDTISSADYLSRENEDLICSIFSGLVELNEHGEPIPDLAEGWIVSEDGLDYTFKIREGVYWSDGEEITSVDFQNYFKMLLSSDNEYYTSSELNTIYGVKDYRDGDSDFSSVAINSPDKYTLKIRMNNKDDELLKKLSKPIYRLRDLNEPLDNYKYDFNSLSYTGAYVIEEVTHDGYIKLKNNPYNKEFYGINKVTIREKISNESDLAALTLGNIDILRNPPAVGSSEFNMYRNVNSFRDNEIKVMLVNSDVEGLREEMYKILNLHMDESVLIKNNIGRKYVSYVENNNMEELFKQSKINEDEVIEKVKNTSYSEDVIKRNLKDIISDKKNKVLKIVIGNGEEEKILADELQDILEKKFQIKSIIKQYNENIYDVLNKGDFDISFIGVHKDEYLSFKNEKETLKNNEENDENNLNDENKEKNNIKEYLPKNVETLSVYIKNELWCKSEKLAYLYIDGNGNLILKYSSYKD